MLHLVNSSFKVALFVLACAQPLYCAFEYPVGSVNSFSMSGAVNLHNPAPLDLYHNPALKLHRTLQVELSLSRLYNLPDFDHASALAMLNHGRFSYAVGLTQLSGSDYYWERNYLLAASLDIYHNLRIGASSDIMRIQFASGYNDITMVSLAVGGSMVLTPHLIAAGVVRNINTPSYTANSSNLPLKGELSLSYDFSDRWSFFLTHHLEDKVANRFSIGQKMTLTTGVDLFLGIATEPTEVSGGISFKIGRFLFDYGFRDNVYLGGTHKLGLRWLK